MPIKTKQTLATFIAKFSSEKDCYEYLAKKRWPNGFVCPCCKGTHGWLLADGKYECSHCHKQVSVTAGTVLHDDIPPEVQAAFERLQAVYGTQTRAANPLYASK